MLKVLQEYLSAFFDLFGPPSNEELINGQHPVRTWKEMIIPILITIFLSIIIVFS